MILMFYLNEVSNKDKYFYHMTGIINLFSKIKENYIVNESDLIICDEIMDWICSVL